MKKLLMLIMCFSTLGIFAQGKIEGTATNEKGEPIELGNIIINQNGKLVTGTTTNFEGFYYIDNLKEGEYEIIVSYMGIKSAPKKVQVSESNIMICDFSYELVNEMTTVVITGRTSLFNPEEPHIMETKSADFVETGKKDVEKIVSTGPSITQDKSGNISFRGSRPGAANYYIDGMSVQGEIGIPTSSIYSMKVYNGGMPARFGNSTGAVIEVRTKSYFDYFD